MTEILPTEDSGSAPGVSRRAVIKAAAWSAPVVAVAVSVPTSAASVPINPADITLTVIHNGTTHGFTITNTSTRRVTAVVTLEGTAGSDAGQGAALLNLRLATDSNIASYGESATLAASADPEPETYKALWLDDWSFIGDRARRSGVATFILLPGASYSFWQVGFSLFGAPEIRATVTSIAVGDGTLEPVDGDSKWFTLP